jgi:tetratricopeptide (TPR) repeat protein
MAQSTYEQYLQPQVRTPEQTFDYFTAKQDPNAAETLHLVESYHLTDDTFGRKFNAGRYWDAVGELRFVLSYFPNHPRALSLFNTCAVLLQKPILPVPYYDRAIHLFPSYAITYQQYGTYLLTVDKFEEGTKALRHALKLDPKLPLAHVGLARVYLKTGNKALAKQEIEAARNLGFNGKVDGLD